MPEETTQPAPTDPAELTYEEYLAMSPAEQQAHYERFDSLEAYIAWYNAALAAYGENQTSVAVTGPISTSVITSIPECAAGGAGYGGVVSGSCASLELCDLHLHMSGGPF